MRPYQAHEWATIVDLIRTHAPWRAFPNTLADADFMSAWLTIFASLEAQSRLSKESLLEWWQSTDEYKAEWPKWENRNTPPLHPGEPPTSGADRLALPVVVGNRSWGDQTGWRPLMFASWFPMLRILRDEPDRFDRPLDMLQSWGVNGVRAFIDVRHPSYWRGREVQHEWPEYIPLLQTAAQALRERGMAWFVTAGDLQLLRDAKAPYRIAADALAPWRDVIAVVDVNEGWQNTPAQDDDPAHFRDLVAPFARLGVPWATSAHSGDDKREHLDAMWQSVGAPVCTVHGPGGTDLMVRHIINHRHDAEGVGFRVALMQGEPRGPGEDVSAGRVNQISWVVLAGIAAMMTGQMYVLHCSRGIRDRDDDAPWYEFAPYFMRLSALMKRLPRERTMVSAHGGRGGTQAEAVFASSRSDGLFYGDRSDVRDQFHRCDSVLYANGMRACLLYGGAGDREAKVVRNVTGTFYNTHGDAVRSGDFGSSSIVRFRSDECGDGLLFVGS